MKLEPIEKINMPELIQGVDVNTSIEVHADRLASFKSTVSRLNKGKKTGRILFAYSTCIDSYYIAKRIA